MIALLLIVGVAVALCVAGWVPVVRDALRVDGTGPASGAGALTLADEPVADAVSA